MSIQISRETEGRLIDEARRIRNCSTVELPVWHLGDAGSLHRRDFYDDVG